MARKSAVWILWAILFGFGLEVAFLVGDHSGRSRQLRFEARRDVRRLYRFLGKGDVDGALHDGILLPEGAKYARDADQKWGRILEAKIQEEHVGPFGLPIVFTVSVKRTGGTTSEHVTRHGSKYPLLQLGSLERAKD